MSGKKSHPSEGRGDTRRLLTGSEKQRSSMSRAGVTRAQIGDRSWYRQGIDSGFIPVGCDMLTKVISDRSLEVKSLVTSVR